MPLSLLQAKETQGFTDAPSVCPFPVWGTKYGALFFFFFHRGHYKHLGVTGAAASVPGSVMCVQWIPSWLSVLWKCLTEARSGDVKVNFLGKWRHVSIGHGCIKELENVMWVFSEVLEAKEHFLEFVGVFLLISWLLMSLHFWDQPMICRCTGRWYEVVRELGKYFQML